MRLVGQSMGGWTMLEYAIAHPAKVKALVLSSTSGTIDRRGADPSGGEHYDAWLKDAEAKIAAGVAKGIHPAMGAPAAERSPALHLLYRSIDEMAGALDKEKVRTGLRRTAHPHARPTRRTFRVPTLLIAGGEDVVFPPFLASAIAATLPCGEAQTDSRLRPLAIFRAGRYVQRDWSRRFSRATARSSVASVGSLSARASRTPADAARTDGAVCRLTSAGRQLWIKRDDCTGLATGGNKTRKLEFLRGRRPRARRRHVDHAGRACNPITRARPRRRRRSSA